MISPDHVTIFLSALTVLSQVVLAVALIAWVGGRIFNIQPLNRLFQKYLKLIGNRGIVWAFIVALTATLGSLFYSEIAGYDPCKLCWFQRIFMYPQVVLMGLALWRERRDVKPYSVALAIIGAPIALYHYIVQVLPSAPVACSTVGYSASCSDKFVLTFGYISIPVMAFTAFLLIVLFLFSDSKTPKRS